MIQLRCLGQRLPEAPSVPRNHVVAQRRRVDTPRQGERGPVGERLVHSKESLTLETRGTGWWAKGRSPSQNPVCLRIAYWR